MNLNEFLTWVSEHYPKLRASAYEALAALERGQAAKARRLLRIVAADTRTNERTRAGCEALLQETRAPQVNAKDAMVKIRLTSDVKAKIERRAEEDHEGNMTQYVLSLILADLARPKRK